MGLEIGKLNREQVLRLAMDVGKVLLKSGAETSRVEDTITRFCNANGFYDVNVFVTPTVIIIGDECVDGVTLVSRIRIRSTNLSLICLVNDFSYGIHNWRMSYAETRHFFTGLLEARPPYGKWEIVLSSAVSSAGFAAMLGGNSHDFIAAFITGGLSMLLLKQLGGYRPSVFWENALAGAAIGALTIFCCSVSVQCTRDNIIVGALMPFLPGVAFTNGLRDYMAGDLISGNSRIAEALLFAISIAVGLAFSLVAWRNWGWALW